MNKTLLLIVLYAFPSLSPISNQGTIQKEINRINIYTLGGNKVDFRLLRPDKLDNRNRLCVPAAFTSKNNKPEGLIYLNGRLTSGQKPSSGKGLVIISLGEIEILNINQLGQFLNSRKDSKFSLFQQWYLIEKNKRGENPFPKSKLQMRVIAKIKNETFIIESDSNVDSEQFISTLVNMGVSDAVYLDMGSWSEGWYKDSDNKIKSIGNDKSNTKRQTNWILFHE
jgi:hypothetical protein